MPLRAITTTDSKSPGSNKFSTMDYKKETLKNNLRVITVAMPRLKSVTAMILVGVGSRYEEREHQGVAHFIEHMMFKGTKKRPTALAIATEMDRIGAEFNAFTGNELTGFFIKAESSHLSLALDILSDILLNSKFEPKEIERERGVILEERRMYRDNPREHIHDLYDELVYGDHPLGWPTIGREETIKVIEREHLADHCRRWYKPGNIVVGIIGGVDDKTAIAEVRRYLAKLGEAEWTKPLPFRPAQEKPEILVGSRKTDQTHLALGVRGYHLDHPKKYPYAVLVNILGKGMSSRLFIEIRERRGLAYYIGAIATPYTDAGTLTVLAGVNNRRLGEAIDAIVKEFKRLRIDSVPKDELEKAKEMIKGGFALSLESSNVVARFFITQELLENKIETPEELIEKIDAVTAEEVQEVAQELFVNRSLNLALIGPFKDESQFSSLLDLS